MFPSLAPQGFQRPPFYKVTAFIDEAWANYEAQVMRAPALRVKDIGKLVVGDLLYQFATNACYRVISVGLNTANLRPLFNYSKRNFKLDVLTLDKANFTSYYPISAEQAMKFGKLLKALNAARKIYVPIGYEGIFAYDRIYSAENKSVRGVVTGGGTNDQGVNVYFILTPDGRQANIPTYLVRHWLDAP